MLSIVLIVCKLAFWCIVFGLPWWTCKRAGKIDNPFEVSRFLKSVLLVWGVLVPFYFLIMGPVASARAREVGNLMYDGGFDPVFFLFGGWVIGLFGTTVSFLIYLLMQSVRKRKTQNVAKTPE